MTRVHRPVRCLVLAAALVLAGCDQGFFVEPASDGPRAVLEFRIQLSDRVAASPAGPHDPEGAAVPEVPAASAERAFQRVDNVSVRLTAGGQTLIDETVAASGGDGEIRVSFELDIPETAVEAALEVRLSAGEVQLFVGEGTVLLQRGRTAEAQVTLQGIPGGVSLPPDPAPMGSIGDTTLLVGAVTFATGDTIPDLELTWESLHPEIVQVSPSGVAVAVSEGEATARGSFGEFAGEITLRVALVVAQVVVVPAGAELEPGEELALEAETRDARGNVLEGRDVVWSSSDPEVVQVDETGLALALSPGSADVIATSEGVEGASAITVVAVPPEVETRPAEDVSPDRATLVADVNPRGLPTAVVFRWGTDPSLDDAQLTGPVQLSAGLEPTRVELLLEGLDEQTAYYYRAEATSDGGTAVGEIQSFETPTAIAAPEGVTAAFVDHRVHVSWHYVFPEEGSVVFEVERGFMEDPDADEPEEWEFVGTSEATSFIDPPGESGLWAYRVRACIGDGCSSFSDFDTVLIPDRAPATVLGTVTLDGNPVGQMLVRLWTSGDEASPRETSTRSNGQYSFGQVGAGSYDVQIVPESADLSSAYFDPTVRSVNVAGFGETIQVDFEGYQPPATPSTPFLRWRGEMEIGWEPLGNPMPDEFYEVEAGVVADFQPPASWDVVATTSAFEATHEPPQVGETWAYRVRACRPQVCSDPSPPDSAYVPASTFYGYVTDQFGNPMSGMTIEVLQTQGPQAGNSFRVNSQADGFYYFRDIQYPTGFFPSAPGQEYEYMISLVNMEEVRSGRVLTFEEWIREDWVVFLLGGTDPPDS